ncbi:hypothetical protein ACQ4PT_028443 [Festuca glaucescens]
MARALHLLFVAVLASCLVAVLGLSGGAADAVAPGGRWLVSELRKGDFSIKVTNWGATLMSVVLPDSRGLVLGYDTVAEYVKGSAYFGGLIGRVANRIAGARFKLDGKAYRLFPNDGKNTLHGSSSTFSRRPGRVREVPDFKPARAERAHERDGAGQGYPGEPRAPRLHWNLGGHGSGSILGEKVHLFASRYTLVDTVLIPTGQLAPVAGTPYDFRRPAAVGARMGGLLRRGVTGYDTNYAVDGGERGGLRRQLRRVAIVRDGASGRAMELWADQPGVQLYTANGLSGVRGKGGKVYDRYDALCLETQGFPDAVNRPNFPPQIVRPGQVYSHDMVFKFFLAVMLDC